MKRGVILANWKDEIDKINTCEPRQDSAKEQLRDLHDVANKLGFYDAADVIKEKLEG